VRHRGVFVEDDPNTLRVVNNLAMVLRPVGGFAQAHELDQNTWKRRIQVLGPDHPYTLFAVTGVCCDLDGLGCHDESIELWRRCCRSCARSSRPTTPTCC
jgi:hypothetical protein